MVRSTTAGGNARHIAPKGWSPSANALVNNILTKLVALIEEAETDLVAQPGMILELVSPEELDAVRNQPKLSEATWGKAVERLVRRRMYLDTDLQDVLNHQPRLQSPGGDNGYPDIVIQLKPRTKPVYIDITTELAIGEHRRRFYGATLHILIHRGPPDVQTIFRNLVRYSLANAVSTLGTTPWPRAHSDATNTTTFDLRRGLDEALRAQVANRYQDIQRLLTNEIPNLLNQSPFLQELVNNRALRKAIQQSFMRLERESRQMVVLRADHAIAVLEQPRQLHANPIERHLQTIAIAQSHLVDLRNTTRLPAWKALSALLAVDVRHDPQVARAITRSPGLAFAIAKDFPERLLEILRSAPNRPADRYFLGSALPTTSREPYRSVSSAVSNLAKSAAAGNSRGYRRDFIHLQSVLRHSETRALFTNCPFLEVLMRRDIEARATLPAASTEQGGPTGLAIQIGVGTT